MAEIVGTVASGIGIATLAAQIAKNVARLKTFWDDVREAPAEISILIEEIETLHLLLEDIQDDHSRIGVPGFALDSTSTSKCLELCRKGADTLQEVTEDLSAELNASRGVRQRWASAKFVFKKGKVQQHRLRLERAVRLLTLAHQIYTRDLVRLQPSVIVERLRSFEVTEQKQVEIESSEVTLTHSRVTEDREESSKYQVSTFTPRRSTKRSCTKKDIARFRIPVLVVASAWEFILAKSQAGWDLKIRVYTIRPYGSPVFGMARNGDLDGLQDLFQKGLASPFDIDEDGKDLLLGAVLNKQVAACRFLIEQGAYNARQICVRSISCSEYLFLLIMNMSIGDASTEICVGIIDLLTEVENVELDSYEVLSYYMGSLEMFLHLKERIQASSNIHTVEVYVDVAIGLAHSAYSNTPDVVRAALPGGEVSPVVAKCYTDRGTLLSAVIYAIGVVGAYLRHWNHDCIELEGWLLLLQELLNNGASPMPPPLECGQSQRWFLSPLSRVCEGTTWSLSIWNSANILSMVISRLLKEFEQGEVDLVEYGRMEVEWQRQNSCRKSFFIEDWDWEDNPQSYELRVYGFTYGPSAADWQVWFSDPRDAFAGEFWNMVEPPELSMPGMWID